MEHTRRKKRPAVWQLVKENIYTHRQRKSQDEDDIMICQCRMRTYGGKGCGPDCLNRLLNIECVPVRAVHWPSRGTAHQKRDRIVHARKVWRFHRAAHACQFRCKKRRSTCAGRALRLGRVRTLLLGS